MLAVAVNIWYDKDGNLVIQTVSDTCSETKIPVRVPMFRWLDSFWTDLERKQQADFLRES